MPKSKTALVTGGAGFIGSHLVDWLVSDGWAVTVIDNLSTGNLANIEEHVDKGVVEFLKGDICTPSAVKQATKGVSVVFHLAAQTSVPLSMEKPQLTYDVNVAGTLNILAACAKEKVGKIVFASTCAVYGEPQYLPVDEMHPTHPISPYAESKLAAEKYCLGFNERGLCRSVVLRFFNVYGPRQGLNDYSGVITRFIENCKNDKPLTVFGDGLQTRDFISVRDVVDALVAVASDPKVEGEIINIGTGKQTAINDLARVLLEITAAHVAVTHVSERSGDIRHSYADISRAQHLGLEPKISLAQGLKELVR
jgi:UDP-glucose 4-epimerase